MHSGPKTLKPARNRFISVWFNVTSRVLPSNFQNSRFRLRDELHIQNVQTVVYAYLMNPSISQIFKNSISGGFLPFGPTAMAEGQTRWFMKRRGAFK